MKCSPPPVAMLVLAALIRFSAEAQLVPPPTLARAADKTMAQGKDGKLNVGFAQFLGLKAEQPLSLKRLRIESDGATNMFNVLVERPDTIILSERRQLISTYYLTDRSGTLKRAVVNDAGITNGGLTNLPLKTAGPGFDKQKRLWQQEMDR